MPTRFVLQPNGRLAAFSSVTDMFCWVDLTRAQAIDVAYYDLGLRANEVRRKVEAGFADVRGNGKAGRWQEALEDYELVHGKLNEEQAKILAEAAERPAATPQTNPGYYAEFSMLCIRLGVPWDEARGRWVVIGDPELPPDHRIEGVTEYCGVFETVIETAGEPFAVVRIIGWRDIDESTPGFSRTFPLSWVRKLL